MRSLNPDIVLLGYQMVIQRPKAPGPGNTILRKSRDYAVYPWGTVPTVPGEHPGARTEIYDPRSPHWQDLFIKACGATLNSYPFDGLFLDQCTVFFKASPIPYVREEMRKALQATLIRLRNEFPDANLVGNSAYNWVGLNGEMDEGRPDDMAKQFAPFSGHVPPYMNMYQSVLKRANDVETVKREIAMAFRYGAYYGAAVNYQHVLWFDVFNRVMEEYRSS